MDATLKNFLQSGKSLISDTKAPRKVGKKEKAPLPSMTGPEETDPYKVFIRKTCNELPKKAEVVEELKRFIARSEAEL